MVFEYIFLPASTICYLVSKIQKITIRTLRSQVDKLIPEKSNLQARVANRGISKKDGKLINPTESTSPDRKVSFKPGFEEIPQPARDRR